MTSNLLIKLNILWNDESIMLNTGLTEDQINSFEKEIDYSLNNDYKEFLKCWKVYEDFDIDKNMLSFWSIKKIKEETPHHPSNIRWFSDYFINLCNFGFN